MLCLTQIDRFCFFTLQKDFIQKKYQVIKGDKLTLMRFYL